MEYIAPRFFSLQLAVINKDQQSWSPISKSRRKVPPMSCCDPLAAECPLDLTEDECRTLIRLLRRAITPEREPVLPWPESLSVILEKLEFAVGDGI